MKKKSRTWLIGAFLIVSVLLFVVVLPYLPRLFGLNELGGFEGAQCELDGVTPYGWNSDWTGNNAYSSISQGTNILRHVGLTDDDEVYWANYDKSNQLIFWDHNWAVLGGHNTDRIRMLVETQLQVPLENLNQMGDPLDWSGQQYFTMLQYEPNATLGGDNNRNLTRVDNGDGTRTYTLVKKTILLVPAELHLAIAMPASNQYPGTAWSGWEEGTWKPLQLWFKLDFVDWNMQGNSLNAVDYAPETNASYWTANPASSSAVINNIQYSPSGGFPISAWISEFLVNIGKPGLDVYDAKVFTDQSGTQYTGSNDPNFDTMVSTYPSLVGRSVPLYDGPGETGKPPANPAYNAAPIGQQTILDAAKTMSPIQEPAYFSISEDSFGTYTTGDILHGFTIKYPAVNYRIRIIYAVWGTFTYLWTVKTAADNGYAGWEDRAATTVVTPSPFQWFWDLLNNPIFLLLFTMFMIMVILVILAIFAPGILHLASAVGERGSQKVSSKSSKKDKG